jgi:DNA-binding NarL/FixJ family response regulator
MSTTRTRTGVAGRPGSHDDAEWVDPALPDSRTAFDRAAITVLVADDHPGFRCALESLVRSAVDMVLLGSAGDGEQAVRLTTRLGPRVVVMDLVMPGVDGVEATRRVRAHRCPPAVIALAGSHERMRDAVAAGAAFTVLKDVDPERLLSVIRKAGRQ